MQELKLLALDHPAQFLLFLVGGRVEFGEDNRLTSISLNAIINTGVKIITFEIATRANILSYT